MLTINNICYSLSVSQIEVVLAIHFLFFTERFIDCSIMILHYTERGMTLKRYIVEFGSGADLHGGNVTEAAQKAIKDAMSHCCLCGIHEVLGLEGLNQLHIKVKVGCPHPEKVDRQEVLKYLSFYKDIELELVEGGLEFQGIHVAAMGEGDKIVLANAAITVYIK